MSFPSRRLATLLLACAAVPMLAAPARAQLAPAANKPAFSIVMHNRTAAEARSRGEQRDTLVRPGDVLHYTLEFRNTTSGALRGVKLSNPLPAQIEYLAASARASRADAQLEFSIDGGKSFAAQPMETVVVDGRSVRREAPTSKYTNVRWAVTGAVAAGATIVAEYDARVGRATATAEAAHRAPAAASSPAAPTRGTR